MSRISPGSVVCVECDSFAPVHDKRDINALYGGARRLSTSGALLVVMGPRLGHGYVDIATVMCADGTLCDIRQDMLVMP